jgi:hypothetical protein
LKSGPAASYTECCEFLGDFITKRPKIAGTDVQAALNSLLKVLLSDPQTRNFGSVDALDRLVKPFQVDDRSASEPGAGETAALFLFGMAGKSLYFLSKQAQNSQFETELVRLFQDLAQFR